MSRKGVADVAGSVALGAWAAFSLLALFVVGREGTPLWCDHGLLTWSVGHRPAPAVALARGVTATGTGLVPYLLAVLAGLVAGRTARHRLLTAAFCIAFLGLGQALRYAVMELVHRPRPPHEDWTAHASGWSYPSGHTTTALLAAGLVIAALTLRRPRGGTALRIAVGCWAVAVGTSRVFLGVHWFTDVVGGWLFAVGWLTACLCPAAHLLPDRFLAGPPRPSPTHDPVPEPLESHASEDPRRRGRSRPA